VGFSKKMGKSKIREGASLELSNHLSQGCHGRSLRPCKVRDYIPLNLVEDIIRKDTTKGVILRGKVRDIIKGRIRDTLKARFRAKVKAIIVKAGIVNKVRDIVNKPKAIVSILRLNRVNLFYRPLKRELTATVLLRSHQTTAFF